MVLRFSTIDDMVSIGAYCVLGGGPSLERTVRTDAVRRRSERTDLTEYGFCLSRGLESMSAIPGSITELQTPKNLTLATTSESTDAGEAYFRCTLPLAATITKQGGLSYICAIEGDLDNDAETHRRLETETFRRVAESGIAIDLVSIDAEGICFAVDSAHLDRLRQELASLNLAVRMRPGCTRFSIVDRLARPHGIPAMMPAVVQALTDAGITIVHCTSNTAEVSMLVADRHAQQAERALRALIV